MSGREREGGRVQEFLLLIFPHNQEAGLHQLQGLLGPVLSCFLFKQNRPRIGRSWQASRGCCTGQLLEAVLLAVSIIPQISQDLAGITNFLVEVLKQLLGHFCSLAWEEGGVD